MFPVPPVRRPDPLIVGAGPAGCAAAITLARAGGAPLLLERDEEVGDPLCGGFLSWRTLDQLAALGVDAASLGGHEVSRLRLFAGGREAEMALPAPACGLSRHRLDTALRRAALNAGAGIAFDRMMGIEPGRVIGRACDWKADTIFLATGKHDLRGAARPRETADPALGLRLRLAAEPGLQKLLEGAIELHLFEGGYAGIVLQEGGSANICMALRKSALKRCGGKAEGVLAMLAETYPQFALRLGTGWQDARIGSIGAVPYGWIGEGTEDGLFRLGDQAAVIPSLAGEGIGIALASGVAAAEHFLAGGARAAPAYQRAFAQAARRPMRLAGMAWKLAEEPRIANALVLASRLAPALVRLLGDHTRIAPGPALAPAPVAA